MISSPYPVLIAAVFWLALVTSPAAAGPWPAETANGFRGIAVTYMSRLKLLTVYGGETVPVGAPANATGRALPTVFSLDLSKPFDLAAPGPEPAIVTVQPPLGATGVANLVPLMYQSSPNEPCRVLLAGGNSAAGAPNTQVFEYEFPATGSGQAKLTTGSKNASLPLYPARVAVLSDTVPGAMGRTARVVGGLVRNATGGFVETYAVTTIDETGTVKSITDFNSRESPGRAGSAVNASSATAFWSAARPAELRMRLNEFMTQMWAFDPTTRAWTFRMLFPGSLRSVGRDHAAVSYVGVNGTQYDIFIGGRDAESLVTYVHPGYARGFPGVVQNPSMGPLAMENPAAVVLGNTIVILGGGAMQPANWSRKVINLLKIDTLADGTLAFRWVDTLDPATFTAPVAIEPLKISAKVSDLSRTITQGISPSMVFVPAAAIVAIIVAGVGALSYAGHRYRERFFANGGGATIVMQRRPLA
ncbi:hypothetical protein H9P43_000654 [Blastocladiella emersonii ATCC 22665]|nr:hypothetical protein H9P43_000654 [Blastocladiella emersonii ATCC 22665]